MEQKYFSSRFTPNKVSDLYSETKKAMEESGVLIAHHIDIPRSFVEWYIWFFADGTHSCVITYYTDGRMESTTTFTVRAGSEESLSHFAKEFDCTLGTITVTVPTIINIICNPCPAGSYRGMSI